MTLTLERGVPIVALAFDDEAPISDPVMKARMRNQFTKIDVSAQIGDELDEAVAEEADNVSREYAGADPGAVAAYLVRRADGLAAMHGRGFWKSAVVRALSAHAGFCAMVVRAAVPTVPASLDVEAGAG